MRPSDLQRTYQRNMLYGLAVAVVMAVALAVWIETLGNPSAVSEEGLTFALSDTIFISDTSVVVRREHPALARLSNFDHYGSSHGGFLGFEIHIIPDVQMPPPEVPSVSTDFPIPEFSDKDLLSFSPLSGDDTGVFIPPDYVFARRLSSHVTPENAEAWETLDQPCEVWSKVDPEYPFVAREADKEGAVSVIVPIDVEGHINSFSPELKEELRNRGLRVTRIEYQVDGLRKVGEVVVAREEPPDWYFARSLLKVLPEWKFRPWIEEGKPELSYLTIVYSFCLTGCDTSRVRQSGVLMRR